MRAFTAVVVSALVAVLASLGSTAPENGTSHVLPYLIDATLESLQSGLQSKQFSSVDLVNAYTSRIREVNGELHAVTEINPDALTIARQLDHERARNRSRGPYHGIPILIKNNIATHDKMNNTAGSYALLGAKVPRDATVAAKLRNAGAVILGKANLSQWANFRSSNSSNGWSALGGQTKGAYYLDQDPSGSSSGSALSSSLGLALASLGTETDGSVLSPSETNNLVGIKPSVGLTSRYLVIPISERQDTVGTMARTVQDAASLLQVIAGSDTRDNYTSAIPNEGTLPDYTAACRNDSLKGSAFGVPRNVIDRLSTNSTSPILNAFEHSLGVIRRAGGIVKEANFTALDESLHSDNESIVLGSEIVTGLATYLDELIINPLNLESLRQVRNFTETFPPEQYPSRDVAEWDEALALGYNSTDVRHWRAVEADMYLGGPGGVLGALKRQNLDAILLPTAFSSSFAAIVGSPVVTGAFIKPASESMSLADTILPVPMGSYPSNTSVQMNDRGNLVATAPNVP
ncbi:MAG: hypothetical protein M1831_002679 [Alyxoria varia]|nr:MAG: hypothetical protein M1831_002679 [Alyxoria varia]